MDMHKRKEKKKTQTPEDESPDQAPQDQPDPDLSDRKKPSKADDKKTLLEKLQRVTADFLNYQKRTARNAEESRQWARADLLKTILPAIDDFEQALEAGKSVPDIPSLLEGFKLVHDHLLDMLTKQQVQTIPTVDQKFDPSVHEAMMQRESIDHQPGTVTDELRKGYTINGRTLRPARVIVSRQPQPEEPSEKDTAVPPEQ